MLFSPSSQVYTLIFLLMGPFFFFSHPLFLFPRNFPSLFFSYSMGFTLRLSFSLPGDIVHFYSCLVVISFFDLSFKSYIVTYHIFTLLLFSKRLLTLFTSPLSPRRDGRCASARLNVLLSCSGFTNGPASD